MAAGSQGTLLSTLTFPEFTDLTRKEWVSQRQYLERNARQLFIEDMIPEGNGNTKRYDEVDIETFSDVKVEGANSKKSKVGVGYNVTMTARTFSKEVDITLEMRKFNRYAEVGSYIKSLAQFCDNRLELDLTHRFTFATSTSYTDKNGDSVTTTVGDGLALLSTAHTLAFSSTTFSNRLTGDPAFSESSLESALSLAATDIYSNFGEKRYKRFNTLVTGTHPGTIRTVRQVLESTADVDAIQEGVKNVYMGQFNHVILPYLATNASGGADSTKVRWWFLAATGQGVEGWQAYYGIWQSPVLLTPSNENAGMDIHNFNWTYSTYSMHGVVTVSPVGVIGSAVSS